MTELVMATDVKEVGAHDAKWSAVGNCSMFGPISAIAVSAARCSNSGIVVSRSPA